MEKKLLLDETQIASGMTYWSGQTVRYVKA